MKWRVYTMWAALKGEEPSPWMIAAEDQATWEGDPKRCEADFEAARKRAEQDGYEVREVTLVIDIDAVAKVFEPGEIEATVEETDP